MTRAAARKHRVCRNHLLAGRCPLCRRWLDVEDTPDTWGYACTRCALGWWCSDFSQATFSLGQGGSVFLLDPRLSYQRQWEKVCGQFARALLLWKDTPRLR
jgi:hypothetical protein